MFVSARSRRARLVYLTSTTEPVLRDFSIILLTLDDFGTLFPTKKLGRALGIVETKLTTLLSGMDCHNYRQLKYLFPRMELKREKSYLIFDGKIFVIKNFAY